MGKQSDTHVIMPLMGEGITEATLVKWLKSPGDQVAKDEPLLEVSTDKVDTEIPAPTGGFLIATFANAGEQVAINAVIAQISETAEAPVVKPGTLNSDNTAEKVPAPKTDRSSLTAPSGDSSQDHLGKRVFAMVQGGGRTLTRNQGEIKSSPLVRKIAADRDIDLSFVPGTGLGGRITRRDVDLFVAQGGMEAIPYVTGEKTTARQVGPAHLEFGRVATTTEGAVEKLDGVVVRREKMPKMRGLIAEHMVRSVRASAHAFMEFAVDLGEVVATRERHKEDFQKTHGVSLTFTPIFVHAAVQALKQHPILNVSVDGEDILWKEDINVGCAVALADGLIVPVVKKAQSKGFVDIAKNLGDLISRARAKKLLPEDVQGGTFSITNPGMMGSTSAMPIINQPQVGILCVNGISEEAVVRGGKIVARWVTRLGLTFDHRVVDGEGAAKYLSTLRNYLENYRELPS